ncbi:unnamed protein product [Danaus chrysippus]|uniref:(African queen) hypothetical protein n=1 Tax=Danaus chrysippus TaxID=151541 RepID=A0A8J2QHX8_9NEOP|nr:unnamed protein product [Danaus chrysippus]
MPASSINLYHMQDAKNNFNTMQLAPVCADADVLMGQCQNYHVSTNCYYGFHGQKSVENMQENYDCEMTEVDSKATNATTASRQNNSRKRSAEDSEYPQTKRLREDVSSICSLVGTRSSPNHSASAFNINISTIYVQYLICGRLRTFCVQLYAKSI